MNPKNWIAGAKSHKIRTLIIAVVVIGILFILILKNKIQPRELLTKSYISPLQQDLSKQGHYIPGITLKDENDLVQNAAIKASTTLELKELPDENLQPLHEAVAQMMFAETKNEHLKDQKTPKKNPTTGIPVVLVVEDNPDNLLTIKALLDGKCRIIEAYDGLSAIEKAISTGQLNVTPQNDGSMIRLHIPPMTLDQREQLVKNLNKKFK